MDKPKKNRLPLELQHHQYSGLMNEVRNQACDDWEKYLKEKCKNCKRLDTTRRGHDVDEFYRE